MMAADLHIRGGETRETYMSGVSGLQGVLMCPFWCCCGSEAHNIRGFGDLGNEDRDPFCTSCCHSCSRTKPEPLPIIRTPTDGSSA